MRSEGTFLKVFDKFSLEESDGLESEGKIVDGLGHGE